MPLYASPDERVPDREGHRAGRRDRDPPVPLTIVTNKHLLPIYDRPMIYYPIETLAAMGIREVMVVVGGKSVGDVVELLADGSHFGLDLTYRYQRGALGIAHAIGLARDFVGDDAFCCVLGDNILRGPALATSPREFETSDRRRAARCSTASPTRSASASPSSTPTGSVVGFEEKPAQPKSDLIPIGVYFLRPDAFDVIEQPRARRAAASSRSPTSSTTTSPTAACSRRVYEGHWTDAGHGASLLRAAELARDDDAAGRLAPPVERPHLD